MLIILMFHQINDNSNRIQKFYSYILNLKQTHHLVNPFDNLNKKKINICLTFDDAYYDFYHYLYPFFKKHNIPATIGIPTNYITSHSHLNSKQRLTTIYPNGLLKHNTPSHTPLCTWEELKHISKNSLFNIASHSHNHYNLTTSCNIEQELEQSKNLLQSYLNINVNTFIYPFGAMNKKVQHITKDIYPCAMRIGSSVNFNWSKLVYRIDANKFWLYDKKLKYFKFYIKYLFNKIRGK